MSGTAVQKAPDLELNDTSGQVVRLNDLLAHRQAVLVFNRSFM